MSTAGGPKLKGIGRSGDSDIVLCMDAHDAKSYPGEPTTNTLLNGYFPGTDTTTVTAGWTLSGTAAVTTYRSAADEFFYKGLGLSNPRVFQINGGGWYNDSGSGFTRVGMPDPTPGFSTSTATTVSFWYRFTGQNAAQLSNQYIKIDLDYGLADVQANYTDYNDTEWHLFSATQTSSASYAYYNLYIYANLYSNCPGGSYFEIGAFQIEQKGYATPFVGDGQFARPATTNLMIHGDVGTGQNIYDSSPSKHAINVNGNTTHSGAQSKFDGGSIYFDGTGDNLNPSNSTDFAFGTGDFTVDCWLYKLATVYYETVFETYSVGGSNGFICGFSGTASQIAYYSEGGIGWSYPGGTVLSLNTWYHLAWTRAGNTLRMFVNGALQGSATLSSSDNYTSPVLYVGGRSGSEYINGYMDEMRITKGTALWTQSFTPPTRRNLSAPAVDLSGNYNGGNFATTDPTDVVTYRDGQVIEPIANAYWNFDGTDDSISLGGTTAAASDRPLNAYPFTFTAWVTSDNGWVSPSGMNELLNMNIAGQRVSLGSTVYSGWPTGPAIMYGGTSHWTCPSSAFGNPTGWTHIAFVIYGSNNSNHKIYINGVSQALTDNGLAHGGTAGWTLGSNSVSAEHWVGNIANAQLYDKTLTEAEVKQNFNSQRSRFKV
jgi:hypothetical protein